MGLKALARRLLAVSGAFALAGVGIAAGALPAAAAEVDVVVPGSIVLTNTHGNDPNVKWDQLRIDFDIDTTDTGAKPGDTFQVELPPLLSGNATTFSVTATNDPTVEVARCSVTSKPADALTGGALVCTFTDFLNEKPDVQGSVWFRAQIQEETTNTTTEFTVNGEIEVVDLPGSGGVVPNGQPEITEPEKWGWFQHSGGMPNSISWHVLLPGSFYPLGVITVTDTFNPASTVLTDYAYVPNSAQLLYYPDEAAWFAQNPQYIRPGSAGPIAWTFAPTEEGFTATVNHTDPDAIYRISYQTNLTNPDLIQPGMRVENKVVVGGREITQSVVRGLQGGGDADGPGTGSFQVLKSPLAGSAAAAVEDALTYTVNATYAYGGAPVTTDVDGAALATQFELTAGGDVQIQARLRTGTVVTLTEVVPADTDRLDWQAPNITLYQDDDGTVTTGESVTFTIVERVRTTVAIENSVTGTPSVDIEKWSPAGSPEYDETGAVTNDGAIGDFDQATAPEILEPLAPRPITFTISNEGVEALTQIELTDELTSGTGTIEGLVCTFPDGTTGTTWAGPLEIAARFTCTGTLPALGEKAEHADQARVTAVGQTSGTEVSDSDEYHAITGAFPRVSVGDYVWEDLDKDGVQDAGEPGIPGVTLTLAGPGGGPVTDVLGNLVGPTTTGADGLYVFLNLPVPQDGRHYTVTVTPPTGYVPTIAEVGTDRAVDSSTGSATSWMDLTRDGAADMTLDFGFVKPVPPTTPPPTTPPTTPPAPPATPPSKPLPPTGTETGPAVAAAGALLLLGAGLLGARRRRA